MKKRERIKTYKLMLKSWEEGGPQTWFGFCSWVNSNYPFWSMNMLVELNKQKPKRNWVDKDGFETAFWWKPGSRPPRIQALKRAISLAESLSEVQYESILNFVRRKYKTGTLDWLQLKLVILNFGHTVTLKKVEKLLRSDLHDGGPAYLKCLRIIRAFMNDRSNIS